MKKRLILFIYFFLVILGLGVVTEPYISYSLSGTDYGIVGVASLLEIFYIVPVFLLLFLLAKKWQTPLAAILLALIGGLFLSKFLSSTADRGLTYLLESNFPKTSWVNIIQDSVVAPPIEEPAKLLAVVFAYYFVPVKNLKSILLLGYAAGTGFEIQEQFVWIANNVDRGLADSLSQVISRLVPAFMSHGLYTSLLTFGLALILHYHKKNQSVFAYGLFCVMLPFVLHFLWNLPANQTYWGRIILAFELAFSLLVLYKAYGLAKDIDRQSGELRLKNSHLFRGRYTGSG